MPMTVEIEADVTRMLWDEAERLGTTFDELGNRIIRAAFTTRETAKAPRHDAKKDISGSSTLPEDWFECVVAPGVEVKLPGLYEWRIDGVLVYVGFYSKKSTALHAYTRNVRNLILGRPYRPGKRDTFRDIHYLLREAFDERCSITLCFVENAALGDLAARRELRRSNQLHRKMPATDGTFS